jgi:hypothetical protein
MAGAAGALNGQPFALFGPATVDDRAPALGPHPHQEPVGLLPLPVVWLKSPLHFLRLSTESKIELRIVGTAPYLVKKTGQVFSSHFFVLFSFAEVRRGVRGGGNSIEKMLALC